MSDCCLTRTPRQLAHAHFSMVGSYTVNETAQAAVQRSGSVAALSAAASRKQIACPDHSAEWGSADIALLRRHGALKKVGYREDLSARLVITDHGREALVKLAEIY